MSKRVPRKNNKPPVRIILDKTFESGLVYFSNFIFTFSDESKIEYQTAFTLRNQDSRIDAIQKRIKINEVKLMQVEVKYIKTLGSYEP